MKYRYRVTRERRRIEKAKEKNPVGYAAFVAQGGGKSGVYDISNKRIKWFVKNYREFIPSKEIYRRDKKGRLVAVSLTQRWKDYKHKRAYKKR